MISTATHSVSGQQVSSRVHRSVKGRKLHWFFPAISGALLAVLVIGFAPTFFLRAFFDVPPMPAYLYAHAVVLTTWYVLVLAQTVLVARHRVDLHRRLGQAAAVVAVLVVAVSAFVLVEYPARAFARGRDPDFVRNLIAGDSLALVFFITLVSAGLYFRRHPDIHKRLMILSCFQIFNPVFARVERLGLAVPPPVVVLVFPLVALVTYDVLTRRRPHRVTMLGLLLLLIAWSVLYAPLATSPAVAAFIEAVR